MSAVGDLLIEFKEKPAIGEDPPVLTLTERNGFVRQADRFKKRLALEDTSGYKVVRRNDIAFNPYLLWAGAVAQNTIVDVGVISPLYPTFKVREEHDPRYVARLLLTPQLIGAYDGIAFGSIPRRRRSSVADFLALQLAHLPKLDDQRRIAAILDHADVLRAKRSQVLAHLDTLAQSIFHDMFGAAEIPKVRAGDLMPDMRNGLSPATAGRHKATVLTLSAVTRGAFDPSANKVGHFATDPSEDKRVSALDFLMCRGNGNKEMVGVGAYSDCDRPDLVFPDTVIAGRVDPEVILLPFLNAAWKQRDVRRQIESGARTTNGTYKVNQKSLASVTLPLPARGLQEQFGRRVAQIDALRTVVKRAINGDNELFASLQSRAFRGDL